MKSRLVTRRHEEQLREPAQVDVGDRLVIRPETGEVLRNGKRVSLTPTERRLLLALAESRGEPLSYAQLLQRVWGVQYLDAPHYVRIYVWRLRQKLEPDPRAPRYIITEPGYGYRFGVPSSQGEVKWHKKGLT